MNVNTPAWDFSGIGFLFEEFSPLTPYGAKRKALRRMFTTREAIENEYALTEAALTAASEAGAALDKIRFHLKRIPILPEPCGEALDAPDIFLIKKFVVNYRGVAGLLDAAARDAFGLSFVCEDLYDLLCIGGGTQESFNVSERYSDELKIIRDDIKAFDAELGRHKTELIGRLLSECGIDFRNRDFVVMEIERAARFDRSCVSVEPRDERNAIVRPVYDEEYFRNLKKREDAVAAERRAERAVLCELTERYRNDYEKLTACADAIERFDIALARADLALMFDLTRPDISGGKGMRIRGGRFLPLENACAAAGENYTPLDSDFNTPVSVLYGSNMCGKTIALKTVCFLQAAAQMGFFVPADEFSTDVFDSISFIGEACVVAAEGLGSFGREVVALGAALDAGGRMPLIIMDEPARTTNSIEAIALLSGLLEVIDKRGGAHVFMATHYAGLPGFGAVSYFCMKGLRREGVAVLSDDAPLAERLKAIHSNIEYKLEPECEKTNSHDALFIAEALGLDEEIIEAAKRRLAADDHRRNGQ